MISTGRHVVNGVESPLMQVAGGSLLRTANRLVGASPMSNTFRSRLSHAFSCIACHAKRYLQILRRAA